MSRSLLQTLLVNAVCDGVLGFPATGGRTQGRLAWARLTLGCNPQPFQG